MRTIEELKAARDAAINADEIVYWDCTPDELVTWYSTGDGERNFQWVKLPYDADLSDADLRRANLSDADLSDADLRRANLSGADLRRADLSGADLRRADLSGANLRGANLRGANLSGADLRRADLRGANLSDATGLLDPAEYMEANFERTADGFIVYKSFGTNYPPPAGWVIEPGAILTEVVNPDRGTDCGCGINVAPRDWSSFGSGDLWRCLIRYEWLPGVVVPFHTDGKIRTSRLQLLEIVE